MVDRYLGNHNILLIKLSLSLEQSNTSQLKGQVIRLGYQTDQSTDPAARHLLLIFPVLIGEMTLTPHTCSQF